VTAEPELSVVVTTRDRLRSVAECLGALEAQTGPSSLEAVVVDDGSVAEREIADLVEASPIARLLRTTHVGVAGARNAGARAARAPIVAFTDDDCVPEATWAQELLHAFDGGSLAVAGPTLDGSHNRFDRATQAVVNELAARAERNGSLRSFSPGSNLACRRGLLIEMPFDEQRYFRRPGEDRDWCARLVERGHLLELAPSARVHHRQGLDLRTFWLKHRRYGRGAYLVRSGSPAPPPEPPGFYVALLRKGFALGALTGLLVALSQVATGVGFVEELLAVKQGLPRN
jgi:GT2 family glycosyltransferase